MNAFAAMVRIGRTYDVEDSRTTHRMHTTLSILAAAGIKPVITHGTRTYFDWAMAGSLKPDRHLCALSGSGYQDCTIEWPAWVTNDHFDAAWALADSTISAQGAHNRSSIVR